MNKREDIQVYFEYIYIYIYTYKYIYIRTLMPRNVSNEKVQSVHTHNTPIIIHTS